MFGECSRYIRFGECAKQNCVNVQGIIAEFARLYVFGECARENWVNLQGITG